jgi:hypothetical protein
MAAGPDFFATLRANLKDFGMEVSCPAELQHSARAELFASRTYSKSIPGSAPVAVSQHVAVRDCTASDATPADVEALFEAAFCQAKKVNRVPLPRGMNFVYTVMPCLVVAGPDRSLIEYAERRPRKRGRGLLELRVVVDRSTGRPISAGGD